MLKLNASYSNWNGKACSRSSVGLSAGATSDTATLTCTPMPTWMTIPSLQLLSFRPLEQVLRRMRRIQQITARMG